MDNYTFSFATNLEEAGHVARSLRKQELFCQVLRQQPFLFWYFILLWIGEMLKGKQVSRFSVNISITKKFLHSVNQNWISTKSIEHRLILQVLCCDELYHEKKSNFKELLWNELVLSKILIPYSYISLRILFHN